jgi:hypothetical protein
MSRAFAMYASVRHYLCELDPRVGDWDIRGPARRPWRWLAVDVASPTTIAKLRMARPAFLQEGPMSESGQNAKYSARADVFRSSPKNRHWFSRPQNIALWNFDRARLPLCANRNRRLGAHRRKAAPRRLCSIALSQASLLRGKSISAHCSAAAITRRFTGIALHC